MAFESPENPAPLTVEDSAEGSPPSPPWKFFDAEGLLQSLGIDGSECKCEEEEDAAGDDEDLKLPLLLLLLPLPALAMPLKLVPNLLFAFDETGEFLTSLLALDEGPFGQDCLTGEGQESDDVVDEIGDTRELVDVTRASPSSSS